MFQGIFDLPVWGLILFVLTTTHITIVAVTIYLHRHQAHRALELHPLIAHFFRFWLWLTTGMTTKQWVAVHRKHHAKVETKDDPHSPQIHGINNILWRGVMYYSWETRNENTMEEFGHGTPNDWVENNIYGPFHYAGVVLVLPIFVSLFGVIPGTVLWLVQMAWIPFLAAGVINGIGHYWGYRNFTTPDASTNIVPFGILIGGEELHNNHHAYASSAKFSTRWYEFDIGWIWIRLMVMLGLANVKKVAPKPVFVPEKKTVDLDTVRAVVTHRFQILSKYGKNVIQPILKKEFIGAERKRAIMRRLRSLLSKDQKLMDDNAKQNLQAALNRSEQLSVVYSFQQKLQEIWRRSAATQEQVVKALQEWCHQAEQTGIHVLQEFAQHLRSYTMQAKHA